MSIPKICAKVLQTVKKYDETDPSRLCRAMKIQVLSEPMGTFAEACKGFYLCQSRRQVICVNRDLPEELQRIVLAHELGHAVLHRAQARVRAFHDFFLYDNFSRLEYEANLFAAELLLDDQSVFDLLNDDRFFFDAAKELGVAPELLDFKFRILKNKGCKLTDPPLMAAGDFLKTVT